MFCTKVDRRSRKALLSFLQGHFRYATMNSSRSSSYANNVKLRRLGLDHEQLNKAYEIIETEDFSFHMEEVISAFTAAQNHRYTIGFNGRSSGYLVLHNSKLENLDYKSRCTSCGQLNYRLIPPALPSGSPDAIVAGEILRNDGCWRSEVYLGQSAIQAIDLPDADKLALITRLKAELKGFSSTSKCGVCPGERVNLVRPITRLVVSGDGIDSSEDLSQWNLPDLRQRADLVLAFDAACDEMRDRLIYLIEHCDVTEKEYFVRKTRKVLACAA